MVFDKVYVKNCCCCIPLKISCIILGFINLIAASLEIAGEALSQHNSNWKFFAIFFFGISCVLTLAFIYAVYREKPYIIRLYVFWIFLVAFVDMNRIILMFFKIIDPTGGGFYETDAIGSAIGGFVRLVINIYFMVVILSYGNSLKPEAT